jgi:uncharacterized protein YkwD
MTLKSISVSLLCSLLLWADGCAGPVGGGLRMTDPVLQPHEDAAELEQLVRQAHDRVNAHRASLGVTQLRLDARISRVARRHSARMAQGGAFSHQGFKQRATAIGRFMPYRTVAENLAYNYGNADPAARAFNSWLNSPKHRQAMEDLHFTHTGLAVAKSPSGRFYFTQLFVLPR